MRRLSRLSLAALIAFAAMLVVALPASALGTNTATTLSADTTSVDLNQPITFTATVKALSGTVAPTGTVTFESVQTDGTLIPLGFVPLVQGANATSTATFSWSSGQKGSYQIEAFYSGTGYNKSNSTAVQVTVGGASIENTTTSLSADKTSIVEGDTVTFTAAVAPNTSGAPTPGGVVNFRSVVGGTETFLGQAPLVNGVATLTQGGWTAGTYTIIAEYPGDRYDYGSSAQLTLQVGQSPDRAVNTNTIVSVSPATIYAGASVDLHATVNQTVLGHFPLAGDQVTFYATSVGHTPVLLGQAPVTWVADGINPAVGSAMLSTSAWIPGEYTIEADFVGDIYDAASSGFAHLSVLSNNPTTLAYDGDAAGSPNAAANVSFQLLDKNSQPLAAQSVSIFLNGQNYVVTTDLNGNASVQATLPAGSYAPTASYAGDGNYGPSSATGALTISKLPTALQYTGDGSVLVGSSATISFQLVDQTSGDPIAGEPVAVTIDGQTQTLTSDANGTVSFPVTKPAGTYPISASFGGDAVYLDSTGAGSLSVNKTPTATTYTGDTQTQAGQKATLSATLVDANGNPLGGKLVTISFGSVSCQATTNLNGVASCQVTVVDGPGSYTVTASFAGDAAYLLSSGPGTINVIGQGSTIITDNVTGNFLLGSALMLSGTLTANGQPLSGKTLILSFAGVSCTGGTNASGVATCAITVPGPAGATTTKATFAGDAAYKASSDTKPALVYALAPGGGAFVVGDRTATGSVYFWGSQWWKKNVLSAGDKNAVDPAAFKGYAAAPSLPQCGTGWTTNPGNSTPPPGAPLPAYMAVIVSSQNHKAPGKVISGDTVHVVIVKTDAGYAANPGHEGTGTVVATLC